MAKQCLAKVSLLALKLYKYFTDKSVKKCKFDAKSIASIQSMSNKNFCIPADSLMKTGKKDNKSDEREYQIDINQSKFYVFVFM